jgi:hypothetical protein
MAGRPAFPYKLMKYFTSDRQAMDPAADAKAGKAASMAVNILNMAVSWYLCSASSLEHSKTCPPEDRSMFIYFIQVAHRLILAMSLFRSLRHETASTPIHIQGQLAGFWSPE